MGDSGGAQGLAFVVFEGSGAAYLADESGFYAAVADAYFNIANDFGNDLVFGFGA